MILKSASRKTLLRVSATCPRYKRFLHCSAATRPRQSTFYKVRSLTKQARRGSLSERCIRCTCAEKLVLAEKHGDAAAAEFQRILDHRGAVISDLVGALSRLELGRAYRMTGDKAKAKAAYEDFLALWRNADPDMPLLIEAKREAREIED